MVFQMEIKDPLKLILMKEMKNLFIPQFQYASAVKHYRSCH